MDMMNLEATKMDMLKIKIGDYETLVNALRESDRLGQKSNLGGFTAQAADHPEYGPVVLVMDMISDEGVMIKRQ